MLLGTSLSRLPFRKEIKMATVQPAVIWLIIAAIVGIVLLIATVVANRNQKKKKKGELVVFVSRYFHGKVKNALFISCYVSLG